MLDGVDVLHAVWHGQSESSDDETKIFGGLCCDAPDDAFTELSGPIFMAQEQDHGVIAARR